MGSSLEQLLAAIDDGRTEPVYLVTGDRVVSEPAAIRIGEKLAKAAGCRVETHRRPTELGPLLEDLKTYSLFSAAKVTVAVETALLADRKGAADLVDLVVESLPVAESGDELTPRARQAAGRLLQALHLFQLDSQAGTAASVIEELPDWALQGGASYLKRHRRRRGKRQVEEIQGQLVELLEAARTTGLEGWAEGDLQELADVVKRGLPSGHALVLAEATVAMEHPVVQELAERGALIESGQVEAARGGGWKGLDALVAELERETGAAIAKDALEELGSRTIRREGLAGAKGQGRVESDSTARFAAEYRKLATLTDGGSITRDLVTAVVEDRGEEDVWAILDAVGQGRAEAALSGIRRLLVSADNPLAIRLSIFGLLASFCRQVAAIDGMVRLTGVPPDVRSYPRFKSQVAPQLQQDLQTGRPSPLAGLHPYRLHRAYLAAARMPSEHLARLPQRVLEAELKLKGESRRPEAALAELVAEVATMAGASGSNK